MSRLALITGASSGIGLELAREFANDKYDLILSARSKTALEQLATELQDQHNIKTYVVDIDLSQVGAALELYNRCKGLQLSPNVIVNNAGFGDAGDFSQLPVAKTEEMLRLNIEALTLICRYFLPDLLKQPKSQILNVASIAAFLPGPYMAVYYATKAYVLSFSEALREEVRGTNASVTCLCPGPTWSGFQKRANLDTALMLKAPGVMTSKTVAQIGYRGLKRRSGVVITGFVNWLTAFTVRFMPRCVVTRMVASINRNR